MDDFVALEEGRELLTVEDLAKYPDFEAGDPTKAKPWKIVFQGNEEAIVRRRFPAGTVICREGDYDYTAFYIVDGIAEVQIFTKIGHVKSESEAKGGGLFGLLGMLTGLKKKKDDQREGDRPQQYIPTDCSIDLELEKPIGVLMEGDLFGEMSCMCFYPRSATVTAKTDCIMLEMQRTALEVLLNEKAKQFTKFRNRIIENYRVRSFATHLRSIKEFSSLSDEFVDELRDKIELKRCEKGDVICKQGEAADSLYLIRVGFVQVSRNYHGGNLVVGYLSRGQYFGEIGLLTKGGQRSATCTALDHVDVVKIKRSDFEEMIQRFPKVLAKLQAEAERRRASDKMIARVAPQVPLDKFLEQGLMNAQNVLLIDLDRCTRCDDCVRACSSAHDGITRLLRDGLRYENYLVTTSCRSCTDPVCMIGCPVGSIRRTESLEIIIEDWCIGCDKCAQNCPYGNITMHDFVVDKEKMTASQLKKIRALDGSKEEHGKAGEGDDEAPGAAESAKPGGKKKPQKALIRKATTCDLCTGLKEPSCVYACPHDAAIRVNPREYFSGGLQLQANEELTEHSMPSMPSMYDFNFGPNIGSSDQPLAQQSTLE